MDERLLRLNLGCGNKRRAGFVGVDLYLCDSVDLICDISKNLPFADNVVSAIHMDNVIEHVLDIASVIRELVRVSVPGAQLTIITPHFTSLSSWKDPTHVHHLSYFSFDHLGKSSVRHYMGGGIKIVSRSLSFGGGVLGLIGRLLFKLDPEWYERKFCFIFRASTLEFVLEVTK